MRYLLLTVSLLLANVCYSANLPDFPFVVSRGEAEKEVPPDEAEVYIHLTSFNKDSATSLSDLETAFDKVLSIVEKHGFDQRNIEAKDIRKETKRNRDKQYNRLEILGYETSRGLVLKINKLEHYPMLMSDLISVDNLTDIQARFDTTNREAYETELTQLAGKNAREKAEIAANSLGTRVISVYAISQESDFGSFFATFGAMDQQVFAEMASAGAARSQMFVPETITLQKQINVVFRIK